MTKKETIEHQLLLNNNKILIDLIKQKIPLAEKSQKREDLYFQYLKNIQSNFIYQLLFSKRHLELFKQLENINTDGN